MMIDYTNLTPIVQSGAVDEITFNLPGTADAAELFDPNLIAVGRMKLAGATFEDTRFDNPTVSFDNLTEGQDYNLTAPIPDGFTSSRWHLLP